MRPGAELLWSWAASQCPSRHGQVGTERDPRSGITNLSVRVARRHYLLVSWDLIEELIPCGIFCLCLLCNQP